MNDEKLMPQKYIRVGRALAAELADALDTLLHVATHESAQLPKGDLATDMALNSARQALAKAESAGLLEKGPTQVQILQQCIRLGWLS